MVGLGRTVSLLFLLLAVTSCGFRLRGLAPLPASFSAVLVVNKGASVLLEQTIKQQLKEAGVLLAADPSCAHYFLILERDNFEQQMISVAASTVPRQYQLIYRLPYALNSDEGLQKRGQLYLTHILTLNNDRILGSNEEESRIKNEMINAASLQLFNQIARYAH